MKSNLPSAIVLLVLLPLSLTAAPGASLNVTKLPGAPPAGTFLISQTAQDFAGNTRFRYYPPALRDVNTVGFDAAVRDDAGAQAEYPNAHRYRLRDRDLGQIFTVPAGAPTPLYLQAVTLRVGPAPTANEGGAGGAAVSMQLYEISGTPTINTNTTTGGDPARWSTFAPERATSDDFIEGQVYSLLAIASGGTLPADIGTGDYMRWELGGSGRIRLEPGKQYAWMVLFDEPAEDRGLALANRNTAGQANPIPFGPMPGGYGFRRDGSSTAFNDVFFNPDDSEDMARGLASAIFPAQRAERLAITPGTLGYPDVDTYRDFVFWIHANSAPPYGAPPATETLTSTTLGGHGADTYISSASEADHTHHTEPRLRIRLQPISDRSRKIYLRYDLAELTRSPAEATETALALTVLNTQPGSYRVYGIVDGAFGDNPADWTEDTLTWNNAPQNDPDSDSELLGGATLLGRLVLGGAEVRGSRVTFSSNAHPALLDFIHADTNGLLTFVLTSETPNNTSIEFASSRNTEFPNPAPGLSLGFSTAAPDPASFASLDNPGVTGIGGEEFLTISHLRPAGGVWVEEEFRSGNLRFRFHGSENLDTWSRLGPTSLAPLVEATDHGDGTETATLRLLSPLSEHPRFFLRVETRSAE
ncbi:MAG: DNRLRE domain-containing protein [Puniceicoccaceae bacterium]|nr:MAG: DNRLRE domain-containing protein [Puniceicoccaceae bacterium]